MSKTLHETIYCRKSTRKFEAAQLASETLVGIETLIAQSQSLRPEIATEIRFVSAEKVRSILPWKAPHYLAFFSEEAALDYENIGFIGQQIDLYLQSIGLGACWLGLGKLRLAEEETPANMQFVILIALGAPVQSPHRVLSEFKRHLLAQIADTPDERLEVVRLAPSATNSQPWYFVHGDGCLHAYQTKQNMLKHKLYGTMNRIDMGIGLAHLYVANPETFEFFLDDNPPELNGHVYTGSVRI